MGEMISLVWFGSVALATLGFFVLLLWLGYRAIKDLSRSQQIEFLIGFFGILVLNGLLPLLLWLLRTFDLPPAVIYGLPWGINVLFFLFFAFYRRQIAVGAFALLGFLLVWVILTGVFFFMSCFVLMVIVGLLGDAL
jgi:hypothetical protein